MASEKNSSGVIAVSNSASAIRRAHSSRKMVLFCRRCWTSWGSSPSLEMLTVGMAVPMLKSDGESDIWPPMPSSSPS